jgi:hypothetical protein
MMEYLEWAEDMDLQIGKVLHQWSLMYTNTYSHWCLGRTCS